MPNFNGVNFTVKVFVRREASPGHNVEYFEYIHLEAANKKVEHFCNLGCQVMLMDKSYTILEAH